MFIILLFIIFGYEKIQSSAYTKLLLKVHGSLHAYDGKCTFKDKSKSWGKV